MVVFTERQIELARQLKELGLAWTPRTGHYVYDVSQRLGRSPFQPGVHLICDYDAVVESFGSVAQLKRSMVWLPTWEDARQILRSLGVADDEVELELVRRSAVAKGTELLEIYEIIAQQLSDSKLQLIYQRC